MYLRLRCVGNNPNDEWFADGWHVEATLLDKSAKTGIWMSRQGGPPLFVSVSPADSWLRLLRMSELASDEGNV